jgi:hypothetical protein
VSDADLLRVMAISSCSKPQKNTTVELAESSTVIRRQNNSRYELIFASDVYKQLNDRRLGRS